LQVVLRPPVDSVVLLGKEFLNIPERSRHASLSPSIDYLEPII
jgi:hypothetical protein